MAKVCVKDWAVVKVISDVVETPAIPEGATVIEANVEVGQKVVLENWVPVEATEEVMARRKPEHI